MGAGPGRGSAVCLHCAPPVSTMVVSSVTPVNVL